MTIGCYSNKPTTAVVTVKLATGDEYSIEFDELQAMTLNNELAEVADPEKLKEAFLSSTISLTLKGKPSTSGVRLLSNSAV